MITEKSIAVVTIEEIEETVERAAGHFCGILQFYGAGGEVARIGIGHFTIFNPLFIEAFECGAVHENLTPYFEDLRVTVGAQLVGYFLDGAYIGGDFVALYAVAPGDGPFQHAILVSEADREAIELEFANILEVVADGFSHPFVEIAQFLFAVRITQR